MMCKNALCNVKNKIENGQAITIGYFGGSITEGAGASNPNETSWRGIVTKWFKDRYPFTEITEIQAAIGGTGSDLGAFRCENDLLKQDPDLVFVEFAVNDNEKKPEYILRYMEGIVRQIYKYNANTDIVFIYTVTKAMSEAYIQGNEPYTVTVHKELAKHYGIPSINVGKVLYEHIKSVDGAWDEYAPDSVHPSDKGYIIYADEVIKHLSKWLSQSCSNQVMTLPKQLSDNPAEYARLDAAWDNWQMGWEKEEYYLYGRQYNILFSKTPDTKLVYKFKGNTVGLYWVIASDSGDIEWTLDGGTPQKASSWDKYALNFNRANYCILASDLENGEHTLQISISNEKQPESTGTCIRLIGVLVEDEN